MRENDKTSGMPAEQVEKLCETLDSDRWQSINRQLLTKMLAEFMYEDVLAPDEQQTDGEWRTYQLDFDKIVYEFRAKRWVFDGYRVDADSIRRRTTGDWEAATDAFKFLLDGWETLGIDEQTASEPGRRQPDYSNRPATALQLRQRVIFMRHIELLQNKTEQEYKTDQQARKSGGVTQR